MTQPVPPPPPTDDPQLPGALQLPMQALKTLAQYYKTFHWLIRLTGEKVPPELDRALREIAEGQDQNAVHDLQRMAYGQQNPQGPYEIQPQEIPEPRIGERVLTHDLAYTAWRLVRKQGLSLREAAFTLTNDLGAPCSHGTVANYVDMIDEEMEENKSRRAGTILKAVVIPAVFTAVGFLFAKFLLPWSFH